MTTPMSAAANAYVLLLARIYLAALFLAAGLGKVMNFAGTAGYMAKLGLPMPEAMAVGTIAVELIGGLLVVVGWKTRWVAWGMAAFTVVTMVAGHAFWKFDAPRFSFEMTQFLKNLAIVGGFMLLTVTGPGRLSLDGG